MASFATQWSDTPGLFRRKSVRVRLRPDLQITPQKFENLTYYVVKDPVSLRYYRFDSFDYYLLTLLDGENTLEEVQEKFEEQFAPRRMSLEQLEGFTDNLIKGGLLATYAPTVSQVYFDSHGKRKRSKIVQRLTNILYVEFPLFDPDAILRRLLPWTAWLYRWWAVALVMSFAFSALVLVLFRWRQFVMRLPDAQEFFSLQSLLYLWLLTGVLKTIHEISHGLSCKIQGGEVHDMGILLMCLSPCLYMNVTDSWTFANKWKRIAVASAGIYAELLMASIATWVWWYTPDGTGLHHLCLCVMLLCGINTLFLNGNPLLRFDGYFVFADWLEIPNLREQCNLAFKRFFGSHLLGIEYPPERPLARKRQVLFILYAIASYLYSWVVLFGAIWGLSQFLKPYKLGTLSALLACYAVVSRFAVPMYQFGKGIHARGGRLPQMKAARVAATTVIGAVLLLSFLFLPLPLSRIRQTGLVQIRPDAMTQVAVPLPATLEQVYVANGEWVPRGTMLAAFRNRELESRLDQSRTELSIRLVQIEAIRSRLAHYAEAQEKARMQLAMAKLEGERRFFGAQVDIHEKMLDELMVRAPVAGIVLALPRKEEIGKLWDKKTPLCVVGDPRCLRALVPIATEDFQLLQEDQRRKEVPITFRVHGWEDRLWQGKISMMPEHEAKDLPAALTSQAGGPVPIHPRSQPDERAPQSQHYVVGIDLLDAEKDGIWPGTMCQAKIHCEWRSLGWLTWRKCCLLFNIGLGV